MISVLTNYKNLVILINFALEILVFIYQNKDYLKLLNDLDNLNFFIIAFLIFFFEINSYLTKKTSLNKCKSQFKVKLNKYCFIILENKIYKALFIK